MSNQKQEIIDLLLNANNTNAAIKGVLKNEVQKGSVEEKYIKKLKKVASGSKKLFVDFLNNTFEKYEYCLKRVIYYSYSEDLGQVTAEIFEEFAEDFNTSYEGGTDEVKITDEVKFTDITKKVSNKIDTYIENLDYKATVLKDILLETIFDVGVLPEIRKRI